jgi:hypothetical protein
MKCASTFETWEFRCNSSRHKRRTNLRTHSTPVESVSDRILWLVRIWCQPFMDMLDICTIARATIRSPAVCDMNMPPHRRTDNIAHHWSPLITRREFTTSQFETRLTWPFNSPARLRHGSVAGFMFLLGVTLKYFKWQASAFRAVFEDPSYQGAKYKNSYSSHTCIV